MDDQLDDKDIAKAIEHLGAYTNVVNLRDTDVLDSGTFSLRKRG